MTWGCRVSIRDTAYPSARDLLGPRANPESIEEAVSRWMQQVHGMQMRWQIVNQQVKVIPGHAAPIRSMRDGTPGPVLMGPQETHLILELVGIEGEGSFEDPIPIDSNRDHERIYELEQVVRTERQARQQAEAALAEKNDEEAQFMRRVAAKTRMLHGPKQKELLVEFLQWFMDKTNTEFDQGKWQALAEATGVSAVAELTHDSVVESFLEPVQELD